MDLKSGFFYIDRTVKDGEIMKTNENKRVEEDKT